MVVANELRGEVADELEAHFASLKSAEEAIDALRLAGINAADITVGGPATTAARIKIDTETQDARTARHVATRTALGAVLGGALGTAVGAAGAAIALTQTGPVTGYSAGSIVGIAAIVGGVVAFVLGMFVGGESSLPMEPDAEQKSEELPASFAIVHVHAADTQLELRAEAILRQRRPLRIWRLAHGRQIPAA